MLSPPCAPEPISLSVVDAAVDTLASSPLLGAGWVGLCKEEISGARVSEGLGDEWTEDEGGGIDGGFSEADRVELFDADVVGVNWDTVLDNSCARELAREAV